MNLDELRQIVPHSDVPIERIIKPFICRFCGDVLTFQDYGLPLLSNDGTPHKCHVESHELGWWLARRPGIYVQQRTSDKGSSIYLQCQEPWLWCLTDYVVSSRLALGVVLVRRDV